MIRADFREKRLEVEKKLSDSETYVDSIDAINAAISEVKKNGGKIVVQVYTNTGKNGCKVTMPQELMNECLGVIIDRYKENLKNIRRDISKLLSQCIEEDVYADYWNEDEDDVLSVGGEGCDMIQDGKEVKGKKPVRRGE